MYVYVTFKVSLKAIVQPLGSETRPGPETGPLA